MPPAFILRKRDLWFALCPFVRIEQRGLGKTVAEHFQMGRKVAVHGCIHCTKSNDATGIERSPPA